jgi:hypothetical protein
MLNASHLSTAKFWLMAMVAAAHKYERLPRAGGPAPLERWLNRPVSVTHLRVFGSPCTVHVPLTFRGVGAKLKDTSVQGYIVG